MEINELKSVIKGMILAEVKKKSKKTLKKEEIQPPLTTKKPEIKQVEDPNPNIALSHDDIGKFFFVLLPHKDNTCEDIVKESSLLEYSELVRSGGIPENEIVGIYRNSAKANKVAEELLNCRYNIIKEMNNQKVSEKQKEIDDLRALIGAAEAYYELKPHLDSEVGSDKIDLYRQELINKEKELNELNDSILKEEEKLNGSPKKNKNKSKDKQK